MQKIPIILLGLAIVAWLFTRWQQRSRLAGSPDLTWWQKLAGAVAIVLTVFVILNPEFLALGFLGDAAFFDALVLLFSLQLQTAWVRAWRCVGPVFSRTLRWMVTPSPGMYYLLTVSALTLGSAFSAIQKVAHRLSS